MPSVTPAAVRAQMALGKTAPVYVIVGDDEAEMSRLAGEFSTLVDEELRAFNVERIYATDRGVSADAIVSSARMLPMMAARRVVVVLRAEKLLKPKRRKGEEDEGLQEEEAPLEVDALEAYVKAPEPQTVLVLVASDVDRSRRLVKALQRTATFVECWGLKGGRDERVDLRQAARQAEALLRQAVADAGQQIEQPAARLVAERAGADIATLRADVDRLLLYTAGKPRITVADVREVVSSETSHDDWAVTTAIQRGERTQALKQLALAIEAGGVPYQILGQLAWFVREKLPFVDARRVPAAVEALFRTDVDLKSSVGDPRVLLERLVVELCAGPPGRGGAPRA